MDLKCSIRTPAEFSPGIKKPAEAGYSRIGRVWNK